MKEAAAGDQDDDSGDDEDEEGTITEFRFVPSDKAACEFEPPSGRLHSATSWLESLLAVFNEEEILILY